MNTHVISSVREQEARPVGNSKCRRLAKDTFRRGLQKVESNTDEEFCIPMSYLRMSSHESCIS